MILDVEPDDLPVMSKQFKTIAPAAYAGEDSVDKFYTWLQNLVRYYWIIWLVGEENDKARVYAVGDALTGEALIWYNAEVQDSRRQQ